MFLTKLITSLQSVFTKRATGYIGILLICGMTFALYSPSLFFDFLAISDQNLLRKSYNFDYSTWINEANAITFLSFTFNQTFTGFSAFALRLTSLLIHLINTILVFYPQLGLVLHAVETKPENYKSSDLTFEYLLIKYLSLNYIYLYNSILKNNNLYLFIDNFAFLNKKYVICMPIKM